MWRRRKISRFIFALTFGLAVSVQDAVGYKRFKYVDHQLKLVDDPTLKVDSKGAILSATDLTSLENAFTHRGFEKEASENFATVSGPKTVVLMESATKIDDKSASNNETSLENPLEINLLQTSTFKHHGGASHHHHHHNDDHEYSHLADHATHVSADFQRQMIPEHKDAPHLVRDENNFIHRSHSDHEDTAMLSEHAEKKYYDPYYGEVQDGTYIDPTTGQQYLMAAAAPANSTVAAPQVQAYAAAPQVQAYAAAPVDPAYAAAPAFTGPANGFSIADFFSVHKPVLQSQCSNIINPKDFCMCQVGRTESSMCLYDCMCANDVCEVSACRLSAGYTMLALFAFLTVLTIVFIYIFRRQTRSIPQLDAGTGFQVAQANRANMDFSNNDTNAKNVAIIGGGMAGMAMAKKLRKLHFNVTIYERDSAVTANWNTALDRRPNIQVSHYASLNIPFDFPRENSVSAVNAYLCQFANHNSLHNKIRFNTTVNKIVKRENDPLTGGYTLHTVNAEGMTRVEVYDEIAIITGMTSNPLIPSSTQAAIMRAENTSSVALPRDALHRINRPPTYHPIALDHPGNLHRDYGSRIKLPKRNVSQMIVVTVYNEGGDALARTLHGILQNHQTFVEEGGEWHDIMLVIVADGAHKISDTCLEFSQSIGLINQGSLEDNYMDVDVHLWSSIQELERDGRNNFPPLQTLFMLKQEHHGKLHSHMWALNGIAPMCTPDYVVMIDVGTVPGPRSIHKLYTAMENNYKIAGCCGEIAPHISSCEPLVWAQSFEYKMAHVLEKSFQSLFGYISVLPGAFCAYRWSAIEGRPLQTYFSCFQKKLTEVGAFRANMYLAEDRVLCYETLCQTDQSWTFSYVKNACAITDAPSDLVELLKQRKRWMNGSFFSMIWVLGNVGAFWKNTKHSLTKKMALTLEFWFLGLVTLMNWLMIGTMFVCIYYCFNTGMHHRWPVMSMFLSVFFTMSVLLQLVFALGHKPDSLKTAYEMIAVAYGAIMCFVAYVAYEYFTSDAVDPFFLAIVYSIIGSYVLASVLHAEFSVFLSYPAYFFCLPTFSIIFTIYSFSNIDNLAWGTKNTGLSEKEFKAQEGFANFRSQTLLWWIVSNTLFILPLLLMHMTGEFILFYAVVFAAVTLISCAGSVLYLVNHHLKACCGSRHAPFADPRQHREKVFNSSDPTHYYNYLDEPMMH